MRVLEGPSKGFAPNSVLGGQIQGGAVSGQRGGSFPWAFAALACSILTAEPKGLAGKYISRGVWKGTGRWEFTQDKFSGFYMQNDWDCVHSKCLELQGLQSLRIIANEFIFT